MDDNQDSEAPETQSTGESVSVAGSESPEYVTSAQFADFTREMQTTVRKTMAGMLKTQPQAQAPKAQATKSEQVAPTVDVQAMLRNERLMSGAIHRSGLNEQQGEMVRQLIDVQGPEDPAAFITSFAATMGIAATGSSATQTQTKQAAPNPNPISDGGAPGMTPTLESDDVPIWKWSQDKIDKFVAEKGYREFANMAKKRLPKDLHGVRFTLPKG